MLDSFQENNYSNEIDIFNLPKHIAIIMDGNGRWAKERGLPRIAGHKAGVEALRSIITTSSNIGISHLTLYAFSTENWKRPPKEVKALMDILVLYLRKEIAELHKNNVIINIIGDISKLPPVAIAEVKKAINITSYNTGLQVNIALNYGSRDEIINAVKKIAKEVSNKQLQLETIDESLFSSFLFTKDIPDPDLVIRTSGELRISNFLLWQIAYSELFFTNTYWPDFNSDNLIAAIKNYQCRKRRFGGI